MRWQICSSGRARRRFSWVQAWSVVRSRYRWLAGDCFARQCWISCDPDEQAAPLIVDHVGAGRFVWATDYPHPDHPATWASGLARFIEPLSDPTAALVLGANVKQLYGLD